jgi:hypothetical protein
MSDRETLEALRRLGPEKVLDGRELCPACDSLSPGIVMDGETVVHCPVCHDKGVVSTEAADAWREEMREKYGGQWVRHARLPASQALLISLPNCAIFAFKETNAPISKRTTLALIPETSRSGGKAR